VVLLATGGDAPTWTLQGCICGRIWRRRSHAADIEAVGHWHLALDRAGWMRLAVVFCFGLVHGLGFASALGIDRPGHRRSCRRCSSSAWIEFVQRSLQL
jgi:hypothetical protein